MAKIYLSSTFEDLKGHRKVIYDALQKLDHQVIAMEGYVATDKRPVEKCLEDVAKADIYIGIIAFRYGYVPPSDHNNPNSYSITELELRHAKCLGKPCLIFRAKEDARMPVCHIDGSMGSSERGERIKALRDYVSTEMLIEEFSGPNELSTLVVTAVTKHVNGGQLPESVKAQQSDARAREITWHINVDGSPYPGWDPFVDDEDPDKYTRVFFGREAEVEKILDLMKEPTNRFIIVSGDSGTGKSSVISAGVLPKIRALGLPEGRRVLCVRMVPSENNPFAALMAALPHADKVWSSPLDEGENLAQTPGNLSDHLRRILKKEPGCSGLVLFLDHMEVLFASANRATSNKFLEALYKVAHEQDFFWVLATIRSDYLDLCENHPDMLKVMRGDGHYPLGLIKDDKLRDIIKEPARCAGLEIDEGLVDRIIKDTRSEDTNADGETKSGQSNLPLLAFMLGELFKERSENKLTEEAYTRLGGVAGALRNYVEQVEKELRTDLLPEIFDRLIVLGAQPTPVLSYSQLGEFSSGQKKIVDELLKKRLLRTEGKNNQIRLAFNNEKLFNVWPSLQRHIWKNGKKFIDRMILDRRAEDWAKKRRKSWWKGLASIDEVRNYLQGKSHPTGIVKDYLWRSQVKHKILCGVNVLVVLMFLGITYLWYMGYRDPLQGVLKVQSLIGMGIDIKEPIKELIPRGSFQPKGMNESITIESFELAVYEVTYDEYDRYAIVEGKPLPNDQGWGRGKRPVINVSWRDAYDYAEWLKDKTGKGYRLPTEWEWEYAARSGEKKEGWAGTTDINKLKDYAVYSVNSSARSLEVGNKDANGFKIYDMSGNVWEWVDNCVHENGVDWPDAKKEECPAHVIRGGSWDTIPDRMRTSDRRWSFADNHDHYLGFRLAMTPKPEKKD